MFWILYWQMYCWLLAACCFCFLFPFPFSSHFISFHLISSHFIPYLLSCSFRRWNGSVLESGSMEKEIRDRIKKGWRTEGGSERGSEGGSERDAIRKCSNQDPKGISWHRHLQQMQMAIRMLGMLRTACIQVSYGQGGTIKEQDPILHRTWGWGRDHLPSSPSSPSSPSPPSPPTIMHHHHHSYPFFSFFVAAAVVAAAC